MIVKSNGNSRIVKKTNSRPNSRILNSRLAPLFWTLYIRHDKRLNFDTSGFLEDPKLTRKQRDSRQKFHGDKPKNQSGFILLEHKYINLYLVTPFGTKMQS